MESTQFHCNGSNECGVHAVHKHTPFRVDYIYPCIGNCCRRSSVVVVVVIRFACVVFPLCARFAFALPLPRTHRNRRKGRKTRRGKQLPHSPRTNKYVVVVVVYNFCYTRDVAEQSNALRYISL